MIHNSRLTADIASPFGADRGAENVARGNRFDHLLCVVGWRWILNLRWMIHHCHIHPPTSVFWKLMEICSQDSRIMMDFVRMKAQDFFEILNWTCWKMCCVHYLEKLYRWISESTCCIRLEWKSHSIIWLLLFKPPLHLQCSPLSR